MSMIKFITVWILTVTVHDDSYHRSNNLHTHYQLQYATQQTCEKQRETQRREDVTTRCDFAQVPVHTPSK